MRLNMIDVTYLGDSIQLVKIGLEDLDTTLRDTGADYNNVMVF